MSDPTPLMAATLWFAGLLVTSAVMLRAWRGWLDFKRLELSGSRSDGTPPSAAARIELADLKERVRKLEAIANGIEG